MAVGDAGPGTRLPFGPAGPRFVLHPMVAEALEQGPTAAALAICRASDVLLFEYNWWIVDVAEQ
eukprot:5948108-Alexandrium_andersonii.AAC.1